MNESYRINAFFLFFSSSSSSPTGPNHAPRPSMEELRQAMIIPADCNGNNTTNPVMSTSSNNNHNYNNLTMSTTNNSHATRRINLGQRLPKPSELTAGNQSAASNYLALAHHSSSAAASASSKLPPPPTGGSPKRSNGTNNTHQQLIDWRTPPKPPSDSEREWQRKVETITEKYNQPSQPPHQQRSFSIIPNLVRAIFDCLLLELCAALLICSLTPRVVSHFVANNPTA